MMNIATAPILDEVCELISAQLDLLEDPTSLTYAQLSEFHSRAEKITKLCEELDQRNAGEAIEQWEMSVA